jgi:hypothetical protein
MIKKFNQFLISESKHSLQKEDVIDIFQNYLDEFDEEEIIKVQFTENNLLIDLIHSPWMSGLSIKDHPRVFAKNWGMINGSIEMLKKFGYDLISFSYDSPESPSELYFRLSIIKDITNDQLSIDDLVNFYYSKSGNPEKSPSDSTFISNLDKKTDILEILTNIIILEDKIEFELSEFDFDLYDHHHIEPPTIYDLVGAFQELQNGDIKISDFIKEYPFIECKIKPDNLSNLPVVAKIGGKEYPIKGFESISKYPNISQLLTENDRDPNQFIVLKVK